MDKRSENSYSQNAKRNFSFVVERPRARAKYGNSHITGFVLSHERKRGIDPPMRKTQLSIISETGPGAPDRQFDKKSVFDFRPHTEKPTVCDQSSWSARLCFLIVTPFYEPITEVVLLTCYLRGWNSIFPISGNLPIGLKYLEDQRMKSS